MLFKVALYDSRTRQYDCLNSVHFSYLSFVEPLEHCIFLVASTVSKLLQFIDFEYAGSGFGHLELTYKNAWCITYSFRNVKDTAGTLL